jgi:hypothetical protein
MPRDDCIGPDDRQRIAGFRKQSIETNKYQSIKNTKGLPSRRRSPQSVDLLPKHPNLCLQCCPRSHQIDERPENQSAKIRHHAVTSADSPLLANWIGFTTGTGGVSIESDIRRMTALLKAEITASSIVRRLPVVTPGLLIRLLFHITTRCRLRRVISCVALLR